MYAVIAFSFSFYVRAYTICAYTWESVEGQGFCLYAAEDNVNLVWHRCVPMTSGQLTLI